MTARDEQPGLALADGSPEELVRLLPAPPRDIAGAVAPLIGRDPELQQLIAQVYELIQSPAPRLVTVVGQAGLGKTRLAYELSRLVARLPEAVQLYTIQLDQQSASRPYSLIRLMVGALFRLRAGDTPAQAQARIARGFANLLGPGGAEHGQALGQFVVGGGDQAPADRRQLQERAIQAAIRLMDAFTRQSPLVLLIDDAHHADERSLELLEHLLAQSRGVGLMFICLAQPELDALRPDWGAGLPHLTRIDLGPLDERDTRRLVGEILRKAGRLPASLRNLIVSRSAGNPYFVEELIHMLLSDGVIIPGGESWQIQPGRLARLRMPATLADLLRGRLLALPEADQALLRHAAVFGTSFWAEPLGRLLGGAELGPGLERLCTAQLISPAEHSRLPGQREYQFQHALLQEVAYEQLPAEQRPALHRIVAGWLAAQAAGEGLAEQIAAHYASAGDAPAVAEWSLRAGQQAAQAAALEPAREHFERALRALPEGPGACPQRSAALGGLGEVYQALAQFDRAVGCYERLAELTREAGDQAGEALAWNSLALIALDRNDYHGARAAVGQALPLAEAAGDQQQLALGYMRLANAELHIGDRDQAIALFQRARAAADATGDSALVARIRGQIGSLYELTGAYALAAEEMQAALAVHQAQGDIDGTTTMLINLGFLANTCGAYQEAQAYLEQGLALARSTGNRINEIYVLSNLGLSLAELGEHERAEAIVQTGMQLAEQARIPVFSDFPYALSLAQLGQGRATEAMEWAQQALEAARRDQVAREIGLAWRALALAMATSELPQGAGACFSESARIFRELGIMVDLARTLRAWAGFAAAQGDRQAADAALAEARAIFAEAGLAHELARTSLSNGDQNP